MGRIEIENNVEEGKTIKNKKKIEDFQNANTELNYSKYKKIVDSSFEKYIQLSFVGKVNFRLFHQVYKWNKKRLYIEAEKYILNNYSNVYASQKKCRQSGCRTGQFQWTRLKEIAEIIDVYRPGTVCEFGSGGSSAMFAQLLGGKLCFTTVDESKYWQNKMLDSVGNLSLRMNSIVAPRQVIFDKEGESVTCFDMDHSVYFDLVYVDGPTVIRKEDDIQNLKIDIDVGQMPNIDVELMWENKVFPKLIVIDGRRATVRRLIQKKPNFYKVYLKSQFREFIKNTNTSFLFHTLLVKE